MKRFICLILLFLLALLNPASAQDVGIFVRPGTSSLSPLARQTYLLDTSSSPPQLRGYYQPAGGTVGWQQMTPAYFNYSGAGAPTANTDSTLGYQVGSVYYDTANQNLWTCSNAAAGAAVWTQLNGTLQPSDVNNKLTAADWLSDFVVNGLVGSVPAASFTMTTPGGVVYCNGLRTLVSPFTYTYPTSSDTYDFLQTALANTFTVSHTITGQGAVQGVSQDATGTNIFTSIFTSPGFGAINVINASTFSPVTTLHGGTDSPHGMALDPLLNVIFVGDDTGYYFTYINAVPTWQIATDLGLGPAYLAVNPSLRKVFTANSGDGTVGIAGYDAIMSFTNLGAVAVGGTPSGVCVNNQYAYATNLSTNSVAVLDAVANTLVTTIPTTGPQQGAAMAPSGAFAYVGNPAAGTVSVINTASNTIVGTISGVGPVNSLTIDTSERFLYVTNNTNTVYVVNAATYAIARTCVFPGPINSIWVNASDTLAYAADSTNNALYVANYQNAGTYLTHVSLANGASPPVGQAGIFLQKVVTNASQITAVTQTINTSPAEIIHATGLSLLSGTAPFWQPINLIPQSVAAARNYTVPEVGTDAYFALANSVSGTAGDPLLASGSIAPSAFGLVNVANGGTGARDAATARANLGIVNIAFGGNGIDGAINATTQVYTAPLQKNATTFAVPASNTLTVTASQGAPCIINAASTINIAGSILCTAGGGGVGGLGSSGGSPSNLGNPGSGPGHGNAGGTVGPNGGGGGAMAGNGGRGGSNNSGNFGAGGGTAYFSWIHGGSGGGGGGNLNATAQGGNGGNGGMCLVMCAQGAITLAATGSITNNGSAGAAGGGAVAGGGGGGGGGGGIVWLISQTSVTAAAGSAVTCAGGNGGNSNGSGYGGGGGGGGGRFIIWSPSNTNNATMVFSAGTGGTGAQAGETGGAGAAISINGNPSLPLLVWMGIEKPRDIAEARTWGDGARYLAKSNRTQFTQRELARVYAHGDLTLFARAMTPGFDADTTCLDNDVAEVLRNAS